MKVYLAAMFSWKDKLRAYADELRSLGVTVTSRWLQETAPPNSTLDQFTDEYFIATAAADLDDIDSSDALVLFTIDPKTSAVRGGRHTEYGYAYAYLRLREKLGGATLPFGPKRVIIVGPKENIFHYPKNVVVVPDFAALKALLAPTE